MAHGPIAGLGRLLQLRLPWDTPSSRAKPAPRERAVIVDGQVFPVDVARHRWARRYLVRLNEDGRVRLTVPRGASIAEGLAFVSRETRWIAREWERIQARVTWTAGTLVWWRGELVALDQTGEGVRCGAEVIPAGARGATVRGLVERHWRAIAGDELPSRCLALGAAHGLAPARVSVRNQRSRWGACSSRRVITLNWRLIQMPPAVSDYVILHELAHLDHPNHSRRFWRKVASICPGWREAERWLRRHGRELL